MHIYHNKQNIMQIARNYHIKDAYATQAGKPLFQYMLLDVKIIYMFGYYFPAYITWGLI